MSDKVEVRATEVPGMQIEFQGPIGPGGLGVGFRIMVDQTIAREDLDELFDRVDGARRRLVAREQLPLERRRLVVATENLEKAKVARATHLAQMNGRVAQLQKTRRNEVMANPQDMNALAGHDQRIAQLEFDIEDAKATIPYLEALLKGEDPDMLNAPILLPKMAAE